MKKGTSSLFLEQKIQTHTSSPMLFAV